MVDALRTDVEFSSQGTRCAAWLYLPLASEPRPVIVMAHGLGAVREMRLDAFADRFCAAGYACLVFDYRHFGASAGEPRQLLDIQRQLEDWAAAIRFARAEPRVDGHRVVLWGTSFSGGHVLSAAAADGGVAAVIAQCPFTDGLASSLATDPVTSAKVMALAAADATGARFGLAPRMVDVVGKPGSAALMTAPDAEPGYLRLVPPHSTARNQVPARFALGIMRYNPGRRARDIAQPILFCICNRDSVAPAKASLRHARSAPRAEIKRYDVGHFDIYVDGAFERAVADQLDFLRRHVPIS